MPSISTLRRAPYQQFPPAPKIRNTLQVSELRHHLSIPSPSPLLVNGLCSHWPALTRWTSTTEYGNLRVYGTGKIVEVEIGTKNRGYMEQDWDRLHMPLGE